MCEVRDDYGLSVALSPLVTPSKRAVWTHVACSGLLPWLLPITPAYSHPRGLWPRRHAKEPHLAQRPDMIRQARGHRWRPGPPRLGRADALRAGQLITVAC